MSARRHALPVRADPYLDKQTRARERAAHPTNRIDRTGDASIARQTMPPRRRRGGIQPWQDAQLKEAEDLLNSLTGAADMTTAEIQRTLRAPRLDALPPRAITRRRNVPELGGILNAQGREQAFRRQFASGIDTEFDEARP